MDWKRQTVRCRTENRRVTRNGMDNDGNDITTNLKTGGFFDGHYGKHSLATGKAFIRYPSLIVVHSTAIKFGKRCDGGNPKLRKVVQILCGFGH